MLNVNTSYLQDPVHHKRCIYKLSEVLSRWKIWKSFLYGNMSMMLMMLFSEYSVNYFSKSAFSKSKVDPELQTKAK